MASKKELVAKLSGLNEKLAARPRRSPSKRRRLRYEKRMKDKKRQREFDKLREEEEERARNKLLKAYDVLEGMQKKINGMYIVLKRLNEDEQFAFPSDFEETWEYFWISLELIAEHEPSKHRKARVFGMFKPLIEEAVKAGQVSAKAADYYLRYQDSLERKKKLNVPGDIDMESYKVTDEESWLEDYYENA